MSEIAPLDFDRLDHALRGTDGPAGAVDELITALAGAGRHRALLDALLLKARLDLGLPPILGGGLNDLPEPARSLYEDRYVEAIRRVGRLILDAGDIPNAWLYYRVIGETKPVAEAIAGFRPNPEGDERLGQVVEVAFNQQVNPLVGFSLILEHYGTCSAISAFDHLPMDEAVRGEAVGRLVRQLHEHLTFSLRGEIGRRGQVVPPEGTSIPALMDGRDWLFHDDAYHIDVSHLGATVRASVLSRDPEVLALALELAEYGRKLSPRHRYESDPPFEDIYEDHAVLLKGLLGQDPDRALAHFRAKLGPAPDPAEDQLASDPSESLPAQVLVRLLERLDRVDEAIDVASSHLSGLPEAALGLGCPSLTQLCRKAGRLDRLAESARARGDYVTYAAARLGHETISAAPAASASPAS